MPYFTGALICLPIPSAPAGFLPCDGRSYQITQFSSLFAVIGTRFGGDGANTFAVPDLRGRAAIGSGQGPGLSNYKLGQVGGAEGHTLTVEEMGPHTHKISASPSAGTIKTADGSLLAAFPMFGSAKDTTLHSSFLSGAGAGEQHENRSPSLVLNWFIYAKPGEPSEDFCSFMQLVAFDSTPPGWLPAEGQLLASAQYQSLFALIGAKFGGDGRTNFALPDMRGRVPVSYGQAPGLSNYALAEKGGAETVAMRPENNGAHGHLPSAVTGRGVMTYTTPTNNVLADGNTDFNPGIGNPGSDLAADAVGKNGSGAAHNNMMPYIAMRWIINTTGQMPHRP